MNFTHEQRQSAYKKLPPEIQDFVMANETTKLITDSIKELELTEDQANLADSEILYAMLGLQTLAVAIVNISRLSNKSVDTLAEFKKRLEGNIFNRYKELGVQLAEPAEIILSTPASVPEIPPDNLPMIEEGEVAHEVLPVEESSKFKNSERISPPDYRYPEGGDPYREPLA